MSENLYFMAAILEIQNGGFPQVGWAGTFFWFNLDTKVGTKSVEKHLFLIFSQMKCKKGLL